MYRAIDAEMKTTLDLEQGLEVLVKGKVTTVVTLVLRA